MPRNWFLHEEDTHSLPLEPAALRWVRLQVLDMVVALAETHPIDKSLAGLALGLDLDHAHLIFDHTKRSRPRRRKKQVLLDVFPSHLTAGMTSDGKALFSELAAGRLEFPGSAFDARVMAYVNSERTRLLTEETRDLQPRLDELAEVFRLQGVDVSVLGFFACCAAYDVLRGFIAYVALPDLHKVIATTQGLEPAEARGALQRDSRMRRLGILLETQQRAAPYFELSQEVLDQIAGYREEPLLDRLCKKDLGPTFPLAAFSLSREEQEILLGLLEADGPCAVLLHGPPGTGKTELARALAAAAGRDAWHVQHGDEGRTSDRLIALQAAIAAAGEGLVIVDEADRMLPTEAPFFGAPRMEKGWLNDFMDHSSGRIIWITNDIAGLPESLRRRFTYHLELRHFTRRQRHRTWRRLAADHPLRAHLGDAVLRDLADRYEVNAAGIASALDSLRALPTTEDASGTRVLALLAELLTKHAILTGARHRRPGEAVTPRFDLEAIQMDQPPAMLRDSLAGAAGNDGRLDLEHGLNVLFWGPPGTGKTELARWLALDLGVPLVVKRASDLLDCYVGNTEKNIRGAFDEAAREGAVLFIDEADSFFQERAGAQHSWEVSFVNEFLTQMENHRGILICCTNLLERLDRASLRRFTWKIGFRPLTAEGALRVYRRYLSMPKRRLLARHRERLAGLEGLTFGDFRAIQDRLRFRPGDSLGHDQILDELERELGYRTTDKTKPLGFGRKE